MNLQDQLHDNIFNIVTESALELKYETYVIGGFVRDILLNRLSENLDIDFVCVGNGEKLAKLVTSKLENSSIKIFKNFGTAHITYNNRNYEFVGARKESYRLNSRKPIVENGSLEDDQKRRDFTINAMAISLNKTNYGELIDPFNGQNDLINKVIRTPLKAKDTYSDDPLRMMRAIRFASQLNFKIETESKKAITENANRLEIISQERITEELNKIIMSEKPSIGINLLSETKLLNMFFPEIELLRGVETINNLSHKDNFYHTLEVLDNISKNTQNLWLRWAAIMHDIGKPQTKRFEKNIGWTFHAHDFIGGKMVPRIFKKLKLPQNEKMKYVKKLVTLHLRPIVLAQDIVTDSAVRRLLFDAGDYIDDLMILCDADITSKNMQKVNRYLANFQLVRRKLKEVEEKDRIRNWQPPIDGIEIMEIFNIESGKNIGILKNSIKNAILDGKIKNTKEEAMRFLLEKAKKLNLKKSNKN
ncbi:MAG: HD domain-containing protein [Bacteroidota bacterium]|nr:HD domain-containing protein [Bacteroidota bacterium]